MHEENVLWRDSEKLVSRGILSIIAFYVLELQDKGKGIAWALSELRAKSASNQSGLRKPDIAKTTVQDAVDVLVFINDAVLSVQHIFNKIKLERCARGHEKMTVIKIAIFELGSFFYIDKLGR